MNPVVKQARENSSGHGTSPVRMLWHILACVLIVFLLFLTYKPAKHTSQTYPRRPIKVVVPFKAGGGSDTFVRQIQKIVEEEALSEMPLVVINRPGGSGTVGSRSVKSSRADGYTILNLHDAIFTTKLSGKVPFGPEAFVPIALTGQSYLILAVADKSPYQGLDDFMIAAGEKPEHIGLGVNMGSPTHFGGLLMEKAHKQKLASGNSSVGNAKFKYIQVGGGQARYTDLIGGHIDASLFSLQEYAGYSQKNEIRALAIFSDTRQSGTGGIDAIPTAREQGYEIVHGNAQYWWAPKGTPMEAVEGFKRILQKVMTSDKAQQWFIENYIDPLYVDGDALQAVLKNRETQLASLDMRKTSDLPSFEWIVGGILSLFLMGVIFQSLSQRKAADRAPGATSIAVSQPRRVMAAIGVMLIACAFVVSMEFSLRFEWTTACFIFAAGVMMGRRKRGELIVLGQIALLTGLGMSYLFTRVFTIDLPGIG